MADAPEKIGRFDYGRGDVRYTSPPLFISGQTNYIRADLVDDLRNALERLVDEFGCSIAQYDRIGPDWTHKDGTEVFEVSVLLDRRELIDRARSLLNRTGET